MLLSAVRFISFTIPVEGVTHLHFDATPLCSARVFVNLVNLLWTHGENLNYRLIWLSSATKYSRRRDSNSFLLAKFLASK